MSVAPPLSADILVRGRLLARLDDALARQGAALIAGHGYGKTTLLATYLTRWDSPYVWCDLGTVYGNAIAFVHQLSREVQEIAPLMDSRYLNRLGSTGAKIRDALATLESLMDAHWTSPTDLPVLLVIDECHLARPGSELERCLDHLFRRLPPRWRILVAGREDPSCPQLARLLQYGSVSLLTENDLAFTGDETVDFLALTRPRAEVLCQASKIHSDTAGWPAGVALIAQAASTHGSPLSARATIDATTYAFFARVVLADVDPSTREFLLSTSVLPFLESGLCDAALGRDGSAQQLARLVNSHLFVTYSQSQPGTYRYHTLFQDFLLSELQSEMTPTRIAQLRRQAAEHLLVCGHIEAAADQLLEIEGWDDLADVLRTHGESLLYSGRSQTILAWLGRVPASAMSSSPWLLLYRGRCLRIRTISGDRRSILRRAQILFALQGERVGRALALLEEACAATEGQEIVEAAALCSEALAVLGQEDILVRSEIMVWLMHLYTLLGRPDEARSAGLDVLSALPMIPHDGARVAYRVQAERRLGLSHMYAGDYHRALALLRECCEMAEAEGADGYTYVPSIFVWGFAEAMRGDFNEALAHFEQGEKLADEYELNLYARRIRVARAEVLTTLGRYDESERELDRAGWVFDHWGDAVYLFYRRRQYDRAIEYCESELALTCAPSVPVRWARIQAFLGACLVATGNPTAGKQLLEQAAAAYRSLGIWSRVPGIDLHLSDIAFAEGHDDVGRALLREGLETGHRGGSYHFFLFDPDVFHRSLARARTLSVEPLFVDALERRWQRLIPQTVAASQGQSASPSGRSHRTGVLDLCPDEQVRSDLLDALVNNQVTPAGLQILRGEYGLTWRELQIFIRFYLSRSAASAEAGVSHRRRVDLATDLGVTEHTVRFHINTILSKLGLSGQRSLSVYHWAASRGIAR